MPRPKRCTSAGTQPDRYGRRAGREDKEYAVILAVKPRIHLRSVTISVAESGGSQSAHAQQLRAGEGHLSPTDRDPASTNPKKGLLYLLPGNHHCRAYMAKQSKSKRLAGPAQAGLNFLCAVGCSRHAGAVCTALSGTVAALLPLIVRHRAGGRRRGCIPREIVRRCCERVDAISVLAEPIGPKLDGVAPGRGGRDHDVRRFRVV